MLRWSDLHEDTKGRKGLGTGGGYAAPENREQKTENREQRAPLRGDGQGHCA